MWGNRLGWGISAVLVIVMVGLIALLQRAMYQLTEPTAFSSNAEYFGAIQLPVDPASVSDINFDDCDAAPHYRKLITAYEENESTYREFFNECATRNHPRWKDRSLPGLTDLVSATKCRRMDLFTSRPEEIVNYKTPRRQLAALSQTGRAAALLALIFAGDDPGRARELYEAVFSLGYKLYNERLVYEELDTGLSLMSTAAVGLSRLAEQAGRPEEAQAWKDFDAARLAYWESNIKPIQRIISGIDEKIISTHPGDIWMLATEADERMWRVEATLKLGRQRYNAARAADQRAADRQLTKLQDDDDPAVKHAATLRDLTIEEYRMLK